MKILKRYKYFQDMIAREKTLKEKKSDKYKMLKIWAPSSCTGCK